MGLPWRRCSGQGPHPVKTLEPRRFLELRLDSRKRRGFQASSWVGPGKPSLPLELRGKAGGSARVTTGNYNVDGWVKQSLVLPDLNERGKEE